MPYREAENITNLAEKFLDEHGVDSIPVDIEWIVESKYKINIIPTPGLRQDISADGFITCDCMSIYVDEELQTRYGTRYRFTLAHEMGHRYIHGDELAQCRFHSIDEWKRFMNGIDSKTYGRMEFQANSFAGLVLVPTWHLSHQFDEMLESAEESIRRAKTAGYSRSAYLPRVENFIAERLGPVFEVSSEVIKRRIDAENLMQRVR